MFKMIERELWYTIFKVSVFFYSHFYTAAINLNYMYFRIWLQLYWLELKSYQYLESVLIKDWKKLRAVLKETYLKLTLSSA